MEREAGLLRASGSKGCCLSRISLLGVSHAEAKLTPLTPQISDERMYQEVDAAVGDEHIEFPFKSKRHGG